MNRDLFPGEVVLLRQLVRLTLIPQLPQIEDDVQQGRIAGLSAAYFLLALDQQGGIEQFVTYQLGRIVQQLSRTTEQKRVEYTGQVRGRILWSETVKARTSGDFNAQRYVCREVLRRYDTPENQLVKFMIERIYEALHAVPALIRSGVCYFPAGGMVAPTLAAPRLRRMETALNSLRYHVRLREIPDPAKIDLEHLHAAANTRLEEYNEVVKAYRQYQALMLQPTWSALVGVGKTALLLPGTLTGESERWMEVAAAILQTPVTTKPVA